MLVWTFGPALLAIATLNSALALLPPGVRGLIPNALPMLIVMLVWLVSFFVIRSREQRELQRGLDELKDLEMENRS